MTPEDENAFQALLRSRPKDEDLTKREKRWLAAPAQPAKPDTIMRWHRNRYTVFEDETDAKALKQGVRYRRVGVTDGGRLSDAQITAHEDRLGVKLPKPWRDVYKHFNGGFVQDLYWGDVKEPRLSDRFPCPSLSPSYLALEDVAPLCDHLCDDRPELDASRIDKRLIAISYHRGEAVLLDYRAGDDPAVALVYISEYDNDPLATFEEEARWWPNMRVYFHGLYLQQRR